MKINDHNNIYSTISKEICDEKNYISEEIKEGNNNKMRVKQNCDNIVPFVMHLTNIMDFANNSINNEENTNSNTNINSS